MFVLLTLCLTFATGRAAGSLIVFGDSYADAGTAGHGVHQVIHTALSTPQLDAGKLVYDVDERLQLRRSIRLGVPSCRHISASSIQSWPTFERSGMDRDRSCQPWP